MVGCCCSCLPSRLLTSGASPCPLDFTLFWFPEAGGGGLADTLGLCDLGCDVIKSDVIRTEICNKETHFTDNRTKILRYIISHRKTALLFEPVVIEISTCSCEGHAMMTRSSSVKSLLSNCKSEMKADITLF